MRFYFCLNDQAYNCLIHYYKRECYDIMYHASCIMHHASTSCIHDVMKYDIMKYEVMKYDVMTYDIMTLDFMANDVITYDVMTS